MKLVNNNTKLITPSEIKHEDIGVIRKWPVSFYIIGEIVQKFGGDKLITLGKSSRYHFENTEENYF